MPLRPAGTPPKRGAEHTGAVAACGRGSEHVGLVAARAVESGDLHHVLARRAVGDDDDSVVLGAALRRDAQHGELAA